MHSGLHAWKAYSWSPYHVKSKAAYPFWEGPASLARSNLRADWCSGRRDTEGKNDLELVYQTAADQILHRNICSAVLDREAFPGLSSTPLWFKFVYWLVSDVDRRRWILDLVLRLQLQVMFWSHDYHCYHGYVPFTWPWLLVGDWCPPVWAEVWQDRSMYAISNVVMLTLYSLGILAFGMKGEYPEYTPSTTDKQKETSMS